MRHFVWAVGLAVSGATSSAGQVGEEPGASGARVTCDTMYLGPPGGALDLVENWSNGLPRQGWVACFPDRGTIAARMNVVAGESIAVPIRPPPLKRWGTQVGRAVPAETHRVTDFSPRDVSTIGSRRGLKPTAQERSQGPQAIAIQLTNGVTSGALGGTTVYDNTIDPVLALRVPGAGQLMADDLVLAAGACDVVSYQVGVFGLGTGGSPTFDVSLALWDGQPCSLQSSVIPGTGAEFTGLLNDSSTVWVLMATLPQPVSVSSEVYLAVTFSTDDAGWVVAERAEVGHTLDVWWEDDAVEGCVPFVFSDDLYAGFWATVTCHVRGIPDGACCVGSECVPADAFDCREMGGHFLQDVIACLPGTCATGACCRADASCNDDDDAGGAMDEALCDILDGTFLAGAECGDSDPCQRFRIPEGFEIVEVSSGNFFHHAPRLNNCGQMVFGAGGLLDDPVADVWMYENGLLRHVTNDPTTPIGFPDINDAGTLAFTRGVDGFGGGETYLLRAGVATLLGPGTLPRINNHGQVIWSLRVQSCPADEIIDALWLFDGWTSYELFNDGLSNQEPAINGFGEVIWTRFDFPCPFNVFWTSDTMLFVDQGAIPQPFTLQQRQAPALNDGLRLACAGNDTIEPRVELLEGGVHCILQGRSSSPDMNNLRDVVFSWKTSFTSKRLILDVDGAQTHISKDSDIDALIDNFQGELNDLGEIAWWWHATPLTIFGQNDALMR